jgi:hypothetical protein
MRTMGSLSPVHWLLIFVVCIAPVFAVVGLIAWLASRKRGG